MAFARSLFATPEHLRSFGYVKLKRSFPSQVEIISPIVDELMSFVSRFRPADGSEFKIEVALREALANAVIHGNKEDRHKRVHITCRCNIDGEVSITIKDDGQGFEGAIIPDPTAPENRHSVHGRGIFLMRTLMDEVRFKRKGSVVIMRKRREAEHATKSLQ